MTDKGRKLTQEERKSVQENKWGDTPYTEEELDNARMFKLNYVDSGGPKELLDDILQETTKDAQDRMMSDNKRICDKLLADDTRGLS